MEDMPAALEQHRRIRVSIAAYAYEIMDDPILSDEEYDTLAALIDVSVSTGNAQLDEFFRTEFSPYTSMWVHKHPQKGKLKRIYYLVRGRRAQASNSA